MDSAVGIDIGGTFVDIVVARSDGIEVLKAPSTPDDPARGVLEALAGHIAAGELSPDDVRRVVHGSTIATNALLEGKWAKTALITTQGFRDVLEIGRQNRDELYNLFVERVPALVPRDLRFEVNERVTADGEILRRLDREEVEGLGEILAARDVKAVAVVLLFSYLDPTHERQVRDILSSRLEIPVVLSSDVLPEFREYERTSTTVVSAALRPVLREYLVRLERGAQDLGLPAHWQIMQSNGAVTRARIAQQEPARVILSGPAGGVEGARVIGEAVGERNLISMDMGGTSCDVSMIREGRIEWSTAGSVGGYPVALPTIDMHTIGAGGGSIAWIDDGGALRVGPHSAGADPGPACYRRGGELPTVTDAHLILRHLLPDAPLGGLPELAVDAAERSIESVAEPLGLTLQEAALGILEIADAAMERALRVISVERGHDPRRFALLAFGGAGPLHAVSIARRLAIPKVIIPAVAGVLSAFGLLAADVGHDYSRSIVRPIRSLSFETLEQTVNALATLGRAALSEEGVPADRVVLRASADLRYVGQSHELNVTLPTDRSGAMSGDAGDRLERSFHEAHERRFGHASPDEGIELVTVRVRALSPVSPMTLPRRARGPASKAREAMVWFDATQATPTPVKDRSGLATESMLEGPLLLVGEDTTVLIPPGVYGTCDAHGHLILEVR